MIAVIPSHIHLLFGHSLFIPFKINQFFWCELYNYLLKRPNSELFRNNYCYSRTILVECVIFG